ncbi:C-C motif chemokine 25 isoform X5 [Peromyscus californicus insignis]|uniref:C-C motif chemokine 25 isoform X5 n=1 Tax=Peromyscus californicus insignis TaxID=564181 RepID=UPI0022A73FBB|nr:C-C motif chemokine 25 isoform X5 [Peromyscus californicus insignis]XP_052610661.1 C-C motif chemokine 25 isoform X5 [Peromyscus californicus insignis]XP_052610662.1 C-C motif chemokine 25 isoform X5 [Peromyscus californicus insignis]XP_052610663.1 C-C motif chemokine 25 isoform X5 [Peromyscus californicus insignis]XP_052610665.1 C-C motif chemokine 25 isoform X5 [Peromyscus californicus insignis]XP_052610666.1 C-C motif chemokine 25 isoform X5 [Peromyscus californicus insignis]
MKLWLFACLVACFVWTWVPVDHVQGAFEDCCLGYQSRIKWNILQHARHYRVQEVSGSCNLRAVIFHFRQKGKVCMNPENKDVKRAMEILNAKNKPVDNPQKTTSGSHTERRKLNHMKSKVRNPSSTSMRNATLGRSRMVMMTRKINN